MNLYCRLIFLILGLPFFKTDDCPLSPTQRTMRVLLNDLDINGHMNNGRYPTLMDLGRLHLMIKKKLLGICLSKRWVPVVGGLQIHFIHSLKLFNRYQLTTQVIYWDEKWIYLEQKFLHRGTLMCTALVKALFKSSAGKVSPDQLMKETGIALEKPKPPHHLVRWIQSQSRT